MENLKALIEENEGWLTDRVVQYARDKFYTEYSSTLREAWRISVCGLSKPLIAFLEVDRTSGEPLQTALRDATEFGITQGKNHRSYGIAPQDFIGLLKLYRRAYLDLIAENEPLDDQRQRLQDLILELFDSVEIGLISAWDTTSVPDAMVALQRRNRELGNEKNKYLTVFESIAEPAILLNTADEPIHVNAAANRLLLGETTPGAGYYGDRASPQLRTIVSTILQSTGAKADAAGRVALDTPSGLQTFSVEIQQMLDISDKFSGRVIILQDVTDYLKAIKDAEAANRAKSAFLATISHEIRTPINSILGLTRLLDDGTLPPAKQRHLRGILASGEILSGLIENTLGLSMAKANALQLVEQDFELREMCSGLFDILELNHSNRKLRLESHIAEDVPMWLHGDGHKLRHILMNLLTNALKFTESGAVDLSVSMADGLIANRLAIRFDVTDTGPGLPAEDISRVFEPFEQNIDSNASAVLQGSGLGLAISKHLVEFLGGEISYRQNPAGGSIFSFCLTFSAAEKRKFRTENLSGLSVLVVEDDPVNAMVAEGYLAELGNSTILAETYQDALSALADTQFNVVVTDYGLGGNTGLDLARYMRMSSDPHLRSTPVIVVTASVPVQLPGALRQPDVSLFLQKPFSRSELNSALRLACENSPQVAAATTGKPPIYVDRPALNRLLSDLGISRCRAVIESYQGNEPSILAGMQDRFDANDLPGVADLAHRLIGASAIVGALEVSLKATALNDRCKDGDTAAAGNAFAALKSASDHTMQALGAVWDRIENSHDGGQSR